MAKKYFWLKLKDNFFNDIRMKKLRRNAGGATYTVIYLKLQLLSLGKEGILVYEEVEESFYEEIAFKIDEDPVDVEFTIMFLIKHKLLDEIEENQFALIETMNSIGSETQAAERVRKHREIKKIEQKELQCNAPVTISNTEIEIEKDKELELKKTSCHKYETCDLENANLLYEMMLDNNPSIKKPNIEKWANEFRLIRTADKRTHEQIKFLIEWTQRDSFWKANILSPSKLRKQFDSLVVKVKADRERQNTYKPKENISFGGMLNEYEGSSQPTRQTQYTLSQPFEDEQ